jgi:hypothetical protein
MPWHYIVQSDTVEMISTFQKWVKDLGHLIAASEIMGEAGRASLDSTGQICQGPPYRTTPRNALALLRHD